MECNQCGARRPRTGPCPNCGAPPPGTFSSLRQWKDSSRSGQGPAVGGRSGSGANWGGAPSRGRGGRGGGGGGWDDRSGGWDDADAGEYDDGYYEDAPPPPSRSGGRNRQYNAPGYDPGYQEVDLSQALVPARDDLLPMDMAANAGLPAMLGMPATDEEERAMGLRRPVYIPAVGGKRKRKLGTWRVLSGVLSVMLVCVAGCALTGLLGITHLPIAVPTSFSQPGVTGLQLNLVPVTPVATPGAQATHFQNVTTASAVDTSGNPSNKASHFLVNSAVYVVATVRGITKGEKHTVSIRWYLQSPTVGVPATYLDLGDASHTSRVIDEDKQVFFVLQIPQRGVYTAKLYLDLPAGDNPDAPNDKYLGATINFLVETPTPVPTPTKPKPPTATPGKTPSPGTPPAATPSPSALTPSERLVGREAGVTA